MPANPLSDAISLLRIGSSNILQAYTVARSLRERAEILTGGNGFSPADFGGDNADLTPQDYVALRTAYAAMQAVLVNPDGTPTATLVALTKWSNNPTL